MKTLISNGMTFEVKRLSQYTLQAFANSELCASGQSLPDLQKALDKKYAPKEHKQIQSKLTIKTVVLGMILENKLDDEIIKTVRKNFPMSKFNQSAVSWHRTNLFKDGLIEAKHAPKQGRAYKAWLQTQTIEKGLDQ